MNIFIFALQIMPVIMRNDFRPCDDLLDSWLQLNIIIHILASCTSSWWLRISCAMPEVSKLKYLQVTCLCCCCPPLPCYQFALTTPLAQWAAAAAGLGPVTVL